MSKVKCYNCKKEGHFSKDCKKAKIKDYNYYKTKMLLAKKDSDEQVLLAEDQAWMESDKSSSSTEKTIADVAYYTSESESEYEFETSEYYDNSTNYGLFVNNDNDQEIFHDAIESASENFIENHIDSQKDYECDQVENSKVIAPGMFKLSVSQSVSPISKSKTSCESNNIENTFSSVRRPKHSGVIWKKKGSSNTFNVDLSSTSSAYVCNDAMNVSCNSRMCDLFDDNNFFIFDDESVRISPVSNMPFRKKPRDSMNVHSNSNMNKSLPRTVHKWLPKMQPLAEPVAKWFPRIYLWIINSGCSKHMMGNRALLTNFVEKFLGTVRFGNNDFTVIAGYEDVVIGSLTIKKVYYVEGLRHNLFSVGQFCNKGLEVAFRKSTCFVRNEDVVDLLTGDCSSNLYTIALNKVASNSSTCLLAKASSSQSWLWHQRLSHLNFATINNLVKNNLVQ
nr:integrase, catalytic region, zinc finger, CCHC-type, peptidase aspartic, catalytic [Tanacetum cinerariifolium]